MKKYELISSPSVDSVVQRMNDLSKEQYVTCGDMLFANGMFVQVMVHVPRERI